MKNRTSVLRAVKADEVPEPPKILTLAEAIESGDYLQILLAQRREIANDLPDEKGPAKAALHRQLSLLSKEIEALQRGGEEDAEGGANVEDGEFDAAAI
ncbi:hypothetical protein DSP71_08815 [Microbacterium sp. H6]|nr:hypothetical protein DSP71_08815 [Microbacterium sp. H6]